MRTPSSHYYLGNSSRGLYLIHKKRFGLQFSINS